MIQTLPYHSSGHWNTFICIDKPDVFCCDRDLVEGKIKRSSFASTNLLVHSRKRYFQHCSTKRFDQILRKTNEQCTSWHPSFAHGHMIDQRKMRRGVSIVEKDKQWRIAMRISNEPWNES